MEQPKIGHLIDDPTIERDAIHIAIAPVVAGERLAPGQQVGLVGQEKAIARADTIIGIVDPFLEAPLFTGDRFWLFLFPGTITSLRHDWVHPAFTHKPTTISSREWLENFAADFRMSYEELIAAAREWRAIGALHTIPFDTPDRAWTDVEQFWAHYENVTGDRIPEEDKREHFFNCSC